MNDNGNRTARKNTDLPHGWALAELQAIAEVNPKANKDAYDDSLEVSFVPMPAVEAESGVIDVSATRRLSEVKKGYTPFREGDVLFAKITPCMENGKMAVVPPLRNGLGFGSTEFHVLRPYDGVSGRYLYHFVSSQGFRRDAEHNMTGAVGQRRVPTPYIAAHPIPIPPYAEQKRIVAKIDELFSEVDKGVESLRTARHQLRLFREVALDSALGGADPSNFVTRPLGDLIGSIQQGWSPKCELNRPAAAEEWAIIKTTAVQPMRYQSHECKPFPATLEPDAEIEIRDGDILMTRKGPRPRTGVVCLVRNVRARSMLCDTVYRFRANEELVLREYLEVALNSPRVIADIDRRKSGISDSGISLNHRKVNAIPVPLPKDFAEQGAIVQRIEAVLSRVDNLEAAVDEQISRVATLRQAILSKAFDGELLAQNPDDEPASILLERISAGRDASERAPRRTAVRTNGKKRKTAA